MQTETYQHAGTLWRSDLRPDITTGEHELARVIAWADEHPHVWDIVTQTKSKAFGRGSCEYIGWAQQGNAPEAVLERARHLHDLVTGREPHLGPEHIMVWRAKFTFEHYRDADFTGGFFQQHDTAHARHCLTLDYTPETREEIIDRFLRWCGDSYNTARVTLDGDTMREIGDRHG